MSAGGMTSLDRALTTLRFREPDRVPLFLFATLHGARELGLSIEEYFSRPENVVEGQLRLRDKYRSDCLSGFFHAPIEVEAWGGEIVFVPDGPPNSGQPPIRSVDAIAGLVAPKVARSPGLLKVLQAIEMLRDRVGGEAPVIGLAVSPFSLPVMQMGFDKYFELIYEAPETFEHLMRVNEEFCVEWANAQLEAGATAICCFDPVASPTITSRDLYLRTGFEVARRTLARIKGPTATHMASGRCLPIVDDLVRTGTAIVGTSVLEDLGEVKAACRGKLTVMGNLNGIEMRRWTSGQAEAQVKDAIAKAGRGGGYILSDNHGEIPWQVPDEVLMAISEAVHTWGRYPLDWVEGHGR